MKVKQLWTCQLVALAIALGIANTQALCQPRQTKEQDKNAEITALIDKLQTIAEGGVGYVPTMTGDGFLPLGVSNPGAMLLGQRPATASDAMRELVKRGGAAVPLLIAHLDVKRPTKITLKHEGIFGGIFFNDEYDYNFRTVQRPPEGVNRDEHKPNNHPSNHTVSVGDLCFVALGQIVNRGF